MDEPLARNGGETHGDAPTEPAPDVAGSTPEGTEPASPAVERHTLARQTELLLGEHPSLDAYDVARMVGTSAARVLQFWRALGFAGVPASSRIFTRSDAQALRSALDLLERAGIGEPAFRSLVRAAAHSADRLAVWQVEALVEDAEQRLVLDDLTARIMVLDSISDTIEALEHLGTHAWRRHLYALLARTEDSVAHAGLVESRDDQLPLERAIGFLDVVAYTSRSSALGPAALAELVTSFEERARYVVTDAGGRVVKTLGDGVLFVADDLVTGLEAALQLRAAYADDDVPFEVHGGFTWGRVLARSGDVFGAPVNLASRLADLASAHELLTDQVTWALLVAHGLDAVVAGEERPTADLAGIGRVDPVRLTRV